MHNEAAKHANDKRNRRNTTATKTMVQLTVNPSRKCCAKLRSQNDGFAHAIKMRLSVGDGERWMSIGIEAAGGWEGKGGIDVGRKDKPNLASN